jgi:hypothetical protein
MWQAKVREFYCNPTQCHLCLGAKIKGGERLKLKVLILLALAVFVFSTPILVTVNVPAPTLGDALWDIATNGSPLHPCGDPVNDSEFPH